MKDTKVKIFKDSVHGYINVPSYFVEYLMDNEYFQRLRNIEQTGMRVLYPAAKHDRFSHSLGVFHLGQKAIEALSQDESRSVFDSNQDTNSGINNFDRYKILFLIACLLHDIGHTPFSHSLEKQILTNSIIVQHQKGKRAKNDIKQHIDNLLIEIINKNEEKYSTLNNITQVKINKINGAPHEQLGSYLIFDKFSDKIRALECECGILNIDDDITFGDDLCFIVRMIMGIKYEEYSILRQTRNCFIELLNGDNFDVDKLDYIVRDTQMSGINNVSVDVERLIGSLCVITKTKHINKSNLLKSNVRNITISKVINDSNKCIDFKGSFKGILKIHSGTVVEIEKGSRLELLKGVEQESAKVAYIKNDSAVFSETTLLKQNNIWINAQPMSDINNKPVKLLVGEVNGKEFDVYIENADIEKALKIKAKSDLEIHFLKNCEIKIDGKFESIGSLRIFTLEKLNGGISEIEILEDAFKTDFISNKIISENDYNTYSIGFKKQAINIIANVLKARNYLYLWIYAHHKVVYYANFLIPVITENIAQYCGKDESSFPTWKLSYENLDKLDDYYIWTAMKYLYNVSRTFKLKKEYKDLIEQLFSRDYSKSLYKSLAEFELVFDSFTSEQKLIALNKLQKKTDLNKPLLRGKGKKDYLAGYIKNECVEEINEKIKSLCESDESICLSQLLFVVAEFKQKSLNPNMVFLDMGDELLSISQIPLLLDDNTDKKNNKEKYFYLYYNYKLDVSKLTSGQIIIIREAIKKFLLSK